MKRKILLIEDEAEVAGYLGRFLQQQDYIVDRASSLDESRTLVSRNAYDLILLDLMLPDGTGEDVLPYLRETAPDTPVLMVTSVPPEDERLIKCLKTGAAGYVPKSSQVDELLVTIRRALRE
jgi:DNA-binding response OmpR family regulator